MFTGLVEAIGTVERATRSSGGTRLRIRFPLAGERPAVGESIAVDGACLTVTAAGGRWFETLAAPETVRRTVARAYRPGSRVNLERPLRASDRLGGHFVQGHIDGRTKVKSVRAEGESRVFRIATPPEMAPLIVEKGSVALDGVSLTVASRGKGWFEVMLIPHTLSVTTLSERRAGSELNLEADVIAKYVRSLLEGRSIGGPR